MTLGQRIKEVIKDDPEMWCYIATAEAFCIIAQAKDIQKWCEVCDKEWRKKAQKSIESAYSEKFSAKQKIEKAKHEIKSLEWQIPNLEQKLANLPEVMCKGDRKNAKDIQNELEGIKKKINGAKYTVRYHEFRITECERLIKNKEKYLNDYKTLWKRKQIDEWRRRFEKPLGLIIKLDGIEKGRFWALDEWERVHGK